MFQCFGSFSKDLRFDDLISSANRCNLCTRLKNRKKILSAFNGNLNAKVLFVAEAPGRLGADRTGVPLYGDKTGDNFERLLGIIGWKREDVFITNAVLCNPKDENGNNGTPTTDEIVNCSTYLEMIVSLIEPEIIVSLGITALKALDLISPHKIQLRKDVATLIPWLRTNIFPLYHPGPRAMVHRAFASQTADFMRLAKIVHPIKGLLLKNKRRITEPKINEDSSLLKQVIMVFVELSERITYFKLMKLLYLFDYNALKLMGHTLAGQIYLRQVDGPWDPSLNNTLAAMDGYEVVKNKARNELVISPGPNPRLKIELEDDVIILIGEVWGKYGALNNFKIKTVVYNTEPMRYILKEEKKGNDMRNKPVIYKDKTIKSL